MSIVTFLQQVVTTESGYFCLAIRNGNWQEHFYRYPDDIELIASTAEKAAPQGDVYFSTYLFNEKSSVKNNVLPSRTIQQDLDFADITQLPLSPSQLVRTSPGRHQGYWLLSKQLPMDQHEQISKRLAYAIDDCDLSGWPLGRKVRLPHTLNHKYDALPPVDWLEQQVVRTIAPEDIELLPDIGLNDSQNSGKFQHDEQFINYPPPTFECGPQELLDRIKDLIPSKVYSEYDLAMPDRSRALWGLMLAGFRAGLTRESVYWLARGSANNKWSTLRRGGERELAKDVERAERYLASGKVDTKAIINELRRSKARAFERNQAMYDIVVASMKTDGQFLHTQSERKLFVPHDTGRPISIGPMSPRLTAYIDLNFGLNRSEPEHRFVHSALESFSTTVPPTTKHGALSRYLPEQQLLVVHNNRQTVHAIDPKSMVRAVNGSHNVVFDWNNSAEPFNAAAEPYDGDWSQAIFGSLQNVVSLAPQEAHAVLKCWLMFLLFRTGFSTRPILALLGQPGCLSGATLIPMHTSDKSSTRYYPLNELYYKHTRGVKMKTLSLDANGMVHYCDIDQIVYSGVKPTYTVKIWGQKPFRTTLDHKFLTPCGFKPLSELEPLDRVIVRSIPDPKGRTVYQQYKHAQAYYHPRGVSEKVDIYTYYRIPYCWAVVEARMNGMTTEEFLQIVNNDEEKTLALKLLPDNVTVHHKDENSKNDDFDNLEVVPRRKHLQDHGREHVSHFGNFGTEEAAIASIEPYGEEHTYDISMVNEPNFLVNDVVVHNSTKTTTATRVLTFLYGRNISVSGVTKPEAFDYSMATLPLFVLDNADTYERWLLDKIAQAAKDTDFGVRQHYSNTDMVWLKKQALLLITAHNPSWIRPDIVDRLLLLTFQRVDLTPEMKWEDETTICNTILENRNALWASILADCQLILQTPKPFTTTVHIRIEDFAKFGEWCSLALGCLDDFRTGVQKVVVGQKELNVETDQILFTYIDDWLERTGGTDGISPTELWQQLSALPSIESAAFMKRYPNPIVLGKKLWNLQATMQDKYKVDWEPVSGGGRLWTLRPRTIGE